MPIRNVVTRGYGNGTYSPGVTKLAPRGYTVGAAVVLVMGPMFVAVAEVYLPGAQEGQSYIAGPYEMDVFIPGVQQAQVSSYGG